MIITVNGVNKEYAEGTTYEQIALEHQKDYDHVIALAEQDHKIYELMKKPNSDGEVKFLTIADKIGHQAYVRTATMMMIKAVRDVLGAEHIEKLISKSTAPSLKRWRRECMRWSRRSCLSKRRHALWRTP